MVDQHFGHILEQPLFLLGLSLHSFLQELVVVQDIQLDFLVFQGLKIKRREQEFIDFFDQVFELDLGDVLAIAFMEQMVE